MKKLSLILFFIGVLIISTFLTPFKKSGSIFHSYIFYTEEKSDIEYKRLFFYIILLFILCAVLYFLFKDVGLNKFQFKRKKTNDISATKSMQAESKIKPEKIIYSDNSKIKWRLFISNIIDAAIIFIVYWIITFLGVIDVLYVKLIRLDDIYNSNVNISNDPDFDLHQRNHILNSQLHPISVLSIYVMIYVLYFAVFFKGGKTFGKKIMGVKFTTEDNKIPNKKNLFIRQLILISPFLLLIIVFLFYLLSINSKTTWYEVSAFFDFQRYLGIYSVLHFFLLPLILLFIPNNFQDKLSKSKVVKDTKTINGNLSPTSPPMN